LLTIYDDLPLALGAYNAGPGKVSAIDGIPAIPETQNYIQKILSAVPPPKK
jgi:soluble lytic murein transglycosylase-like protein